MDTDYLLVNRALAVTYRNALLDNNGKRGAFGCFIGNFSNRNNTIMLTSSFNVQSLYLNSTAPTYSFGRHFDHSNPIVLHYFQN